MINITKDQLLKDFSRVKGFCRSYFKNPMEHIKNPTIIEWESAVVGMFAINIVYGILRAVYHFNVLNVVIGLIVTPIMAASVLLLTTLFLFYFFQFSFQKNFPFKNIASVLFISYLPASLFFLASVFYGPLFVLGMILMAGLLAVALTKYMDIPRKTALSLVTAGFFLALIFWIFDQFFVMRTPVEPKTLDQLENEIESL